MSTSPASMWEQRYQAPEYFYGTSPNDFLAANRAALGDGPALCLAEGEGRNAVFLASSGLPVTSVDLAAAGVDKTRRLALERGVEVDARQGDLATFDLGVERWATIVAIFVHLPPAVRVDLHRRVVAALRPGGTFLCEGYTAAQLGRGTGGPGSPELFVSEAILRRELEGLEVLRATECERDVIEGTGHSGRGAVVQFLARKPSAV
jgi:hypothetical protein